MNKLLDMLRYCRPEGSLHQAAFCNRFLEPVFGHPDRFGNYIKVVGSHPRVAFMAHHDTVHHDSGLQIVAIDDDDFITSNSNCLGADCTTGVWLILEMLAAPNPQPGVYVIHAGEEIGCKGSRAITDNLKLYPWIEDLDAAISFDRRGQDSVVTHQIGKRTCSDAFALSLIDILDIPGLKPDPKGVYTDSNEYAFAVSECTNISVGYEHQHSSREFQDLNFALVLRDALLAADFSRLTIARDRSTDEFEDDDDLELYDLIDRYPDLVAEWLENSGITGTLLRQELGLA